MMLLLINACLDNLENEDGKIWKTKVKCNFLEGMKMSDFDSGHGVIFTWYV